MTSRGKRFMRATGKLPALKAKQELPLPLRHVPRGASSTEQQGKTGPDTANLGGDAIMSVKASKLGTKIVPSPSQPRGAKPGWLAQATPAVRSQSPGIRAAHGRGAAGRKKGKKLKGGKGNKKG